ncbi:heme ABC transporter ATP-binding protein [Thiomicrospira microaerophila]|nr:heme ABC transporter ATP-binding protein [Thiomicrospira microaerophila]UQB42183.1 heme ABC transporter ATP-binding protein [Thiomicrospira microaerophila]
MISVEDFNLTLNGKAILQQVSVEIEAGEVFVILGPNGAGKSSLLKVLAGELEAYKPAVQFHQRPLSSYAPRELAQLRAVMPQSVHLDFPFLAEEVVSMAIPYAGKAEVKRRVDEALALFDVSHFAQRNYLTLSGGEQQRVQLARVLAQILTAAKQAEQTGGLPPLLLLDECTSSLDLAHQQQVFKVLRRLARDVKMAVVAVLHDLNLASQYADRALLLSEGKIVQQGPVHQVLTQSTIEAVYQTPVEIIERPDRYLVIVPVESR